MNRSAIKMEMWSLTGPFLSLGALSILFIQQSPLTLFLCFTALIGIWLCCKWKFQGLLASLILLLSYFFYQIFYVKIDQSLWYAGVGFALCLSFFITTLCYEEMSEEVDSLKDELSILREKAKLHQKELQDSQLRVDEAYQRMRSSEAILKELSSELSKEQSLNHEYLEQVSKIQQDVAFHQNGLHILQEQLHQSTLEKEETLQLLKTTQEELAKEKEKVPQIQSLPLESHGWLRRSEGMYNQLKEQFEEKNNALEEARRELFFMQEKYLLLQREYEDRWCENTTLDSIEKYLLKLEEELVYTEQENIKLHQLVNQLM